MNRKPKSRSQGRRLHALLAGSVLVAGLCLAATAVDATPITLTAAVGGVPTGTNYANFDSIPLGSAGGTSNGITVQFSPDAQAVQGGKPNLYAAPFLSANNGMSFGDPNDGADATTYLTSGSEGGPSAGAAVTLSFASPVKYMGLLWGSVDGYNTLTFYSGGVEIGSITGDDVTASANGNQGASGTFYVNINSSQSFDKVVATSTQYAFEFDNVAFDSNMVSVPEPGATDMFLLGLLLVGSGYWLERRKRS